MMQGNRVRLRPIEREDLPRYVRWFADPEFRFLIATYQPFSLSDEERWFEQNSAAGELRAWAIDAQVDLEAPNPPERWMHVGSCGFHKIDWRNRSGEVGIAIGDRNYWGQGFGTEAMRLLLDWGFGTLNLNRIYLRVFADNPRAIRSYEKLGFLHEGRMRQDEFRDGKYRDTLLMALLREEWLEH
ncbi:MAG TPA: GNAT family protein [Acidobacteriota bacterium]|nr:GNAT family protein [Acidobacteriota bacterium]